MSDTNPSLQPSTSGGTAIISREKSDNAEDPFDKTDFSAAQYVNELFPDGR